MSKFLKFIVNFIMLCTVAVALALLVPPLAGVKTVMIDDSGKDTNLPLGSVTYGQGVAVEELQEGDKIVIANGGSAYEYIIEGMDGTAGTYILADAHDDAAEEQTVELSGQAAKSVITIPYIAYAAMAMQSIEGLIIAGLVIVFLIILFILSELWKKEDEDDDEEEESEDDEEEEEEERPLTRKERKRAAKEAKKEAKRAAKEEKKRRKKGYVEEEDEYEDDGDEKEDEAEEAESLEEENEEDTTAESVINASMASVVSDISEITSVKEEVPVDGTQKMPSKEEVEEAVRETQQEEVKEENVSRKQDDLEIIAARERILSYPSAGELISKATVDGDEPEIIEDENSGVTLLDYSKII